MSQAGQPHSNVVVDMPTLQAIMLGWRFFFIRLLLPLWRLAFLVLARDGSRPVYGNDVARAQFINHQNLLRLHSSALSFPAVPTWRYP